jgi:hypothetical protein
MAEELNNTEVVEEVETVDAPEETQPKEETFTKTQLEEIVKQRVAREKKAAEKAVEEAKKLAKMNEDEKAKYELEQLQNELAELKRKDVRNGLAKEATKMLSEHDIQVDEDLLAFVVKDTAEDTQTAVNSFVTIINAKVEQGVKKALSGSAPRVNTNAGVALTKDAFDKMSYSEKLELKRTNEALYKQFTTL